MNPLYFSRLVTDLTGKVIFKVEKMRMATETTKILIRIFRLQIEFFLTLALSTVQYIRVFMKK